MTDSELLKLFLVFLIVIENCLNLRKGLRSLKFIDLVCKGISRNIVLKCQLELGNNPLVKCNFKGYIRDWDRFSESTLDFEDPEFLWIFLLLLFDMFSNIFDRLDDILNSGESAFAPNHITDGELELFFILESVFNLILILFFALL